MSFAATVSAGPPPDPTRGLTGIQLARAVCRDPDPGAARSALERIDALLAAAEQLTLGTRTQRTRALGLLMTATAIAATEPIDQTTHATTPGVETQKPKRPPRPRRANLPNLTGRAHRAHIASPPTPTHLNT
jgi:hypothetical protein